MVRGSDLRSILISTRPTFSMVPTDFVAFRAPSGRLVGLTACMIDFELFYHAFYHVQGQRPKTRDSKRLYDIFTVCTDIITPEQQLCVGSSRRRY